MNWFITLAALFLLPLSQGALAPDKGLTAQRPADFHIQLPINRAAYETPAPQGDAVQTQQATKPRLTYAEFIAAKQPQEHTLAALIHRFIAEMDGVGCEAVKPLTDSHRYALLRLQRSWLAQKPAAKLNKHDIINWCKERIKTVAASTNLQDLSFLVGVLKYAPSAWDDCDDVSHACITAAKPFLVKNGLIAKGTPRKRVPTDEEEAKLLQYFVEYTKRPRVKLKVVPVILFALASTRRISEICRMTHGDIDWEHKDEKGNLAPVYMVRDLKHPKHKKGNDKTFPLLDPMPEIIRMMPRLRPDDPRERVFPFYEKSVGAAYTIAKHKLGIEDLHFHDNRRESITRWLAVFKSAHLVRRISGHETTVILERVYDATDPASLHGELLALAKPQPEART